VHGDAQEWGDLRANQAYIYAAGAAGSSVVWVSHFQFAGTFVNEKMVKQENKENKGM